MSNNAGGSAYRVIRKVDKYLSTTEAVLAGVSYAAMIVIVFAGVIMRYWLKIPNLYGEELSRYLMIASIFLGIAVACRRRMHMNVSMFVDVFPKKLGQIVRVFVRLVVVTVYVFMTYQGVQIVRQMMTLTQSSPAMRLPMWIMYAVITLGFALSAVTEIILFANDFFCDGKLLEDGAKESEEA